MIDSKEFTSKCINILAKKLLSKQSSESRHQVDALWFDSWSSVKISLIVRTSRVNPCIPSGIITAYPREKMWTRTRKGSVRDILTDHDNNKFNCATVNLFCYLFRFFSFHSHICKCNDVGRLTNLNKITFEGEWWIALKTTLYVISNPRKKIKTAMSQFFLKNNQTNLLKAPSNRAPCVDHVVKGPNVTLKNRKPSLKEPCQMSTARWITKTNVVL